MPDVNNTADLIKILSAGSFGAVIAAAIAALSQRRKLGSDATVAVTQAARELVDPLRQELANERAANAEEIELERQKVAQVRSELQAMIEETVTLRRELRLARLEADKLRQENAAYKRRVQELEEELSLHRRKS